MRSLHLIPLYDPDHQKYIEVCEYGARHGEANLDYRVSGRQDADSLQQTSITEDSLGIGCSRYFVHFLTMRDFGEENGASTPSFSFW